jgi:hypothetical protein
MPSDEPTSAADAGDHPGDTPLSTVTSHIGKEHGDGQFGVAEHAHIRCFTCHETFDAHGVTADRMTRLEGASDPSDMSIVIPVTCPNCGTAGSLVLNYGPESSADEADVLDAMERNRPEVGAVGADPTPGISA